jgi:glycosyltransferase involved in cell wall biosynthesis
MVFDSIRIGIVTPHKLQGYGVSVRLNRETKAYQKLSIPVTVLSTSERGFLNNSEIVGINSSIARSVSQIVGFDRIANSELIVRRLFAKKNLFSLMKNLGKKTAVEAEKRQLNVLQSDDLIGSLISLEAKKEMKKDPIIIGEFADLIHLDFKQRFRLEDSDGLVCGLKEMLCEVFEGLDFAFFVSPIDKEIAVKELGLSQNKAQTIYEAADRDAICKSHYNQSPNSVCYLGALASWENPDLFVLSYQHASKCNSKIVYSIVGDGPFAKETKNRAKKNNHILFYGWRPYSEALRIAANSDLGVIASSKIRAMPSKLFVYSSLGLPVVSLEGMWWSEDFVKRFNIGYLASPSPESLGNVIKQALQNPDELEKQGSRARKLIEEEYNWDSRTNKMLQVYENLMDN